MRDLSPLRNAANYREFLSAYLLLKELSVAQFARRAGFTSRGYPSEILKGRRRLSPKAMPGILRALQLPAPWKQYFQYLVALETPEILPNALDSAQIQMRLEKLRRNLKALPLRSEIVQPKESAESIFQIEGFLRIYASLGDAETGATMRDVLSRTRLSRSKVESALEQMQRLELVTASGSPTVYRPSATHLASVGMGDSNFFQRCFLETIAGIRDSAQKRFRSQKELFLASAFTVRAADLPEIKRELRELITKYIDDRIEADGDTTVDLAVGLVTP